MITSVMIASPGFACSLDLVLQQSGRGNGTAKTDTPFFYQNTGYTCLNQSDGVYSGSNTASENDHVAINIFI